MECEDNLQRGEVPDPNPRDEIFERVYTAVSRRGRSGRKPNSQRTTLSAAKQQMLGDGPCH